MAWPILNHLKRKLTAGLLVVIPIGLTLFILRFLFDLADSFLAPVIRQGVDFFLGKDFYIPGLGMIAGIFVLYLVGVLFSNVLGSRIIAWWDRQLGRIPLVKSIYTSSKQLMEVLAKSGKSSFRRAVYVEFPKEECFSIAFVTNSVQTESGRTYFTVFIPTSPNPTSGYVLVLEEHRVFPAAFGVEEAMKIIMSGGMVTPEVIKAERLQ